MKYFILLGGFAGFFLTFMTGLLTGQEPGHILFNAGIGCLIGATLMRGFRLIFTHCVRSAMLEKSRLHTATPAPQ